MKSTAGPIMLGYLPDYYLTSLIMAAILDAQGGEVDKLNDALNETLNQFFVDNATWNISAWENELGITPDDSKPIDQRRSVVKSKLRGYGTTTAALVQSVATAYTNGQTSVTQDFANYKVTVTFIGELGIPPNLTDIQNAIGNVMPAHLQLLFAYTYMHFDQLDSYAFTFDGLDAKALDWNQFETYSQ